MSTILAAPLHDQPAPLAVALAGMGVDEVETHLEPGILGDDLAYRDAVIARLIEIDPRRGEGPRLAAIELDRQVAELVERGATVEQLEAELAVTPRWKDGHLRRVALLAALRRAVA